MTLVRTWPEPRRARGHFAGLLVALLVAGVVQPAGAAVAPPRLRLIAPAEEVTLYRYGRGEPVHLDIPVLVAATGAPFELVAQRPDYAQPPVLTQVLRGPGSQTELRPLDPTLLDGWTGLKDFFEISFTDPAGVDVAAAKIGFCPSGHERERVDDSGPEVPTYPPACYSNPFTRGLVWGIDESWAVSATGYDAPAVAIPNGKFTLTIRIAPIYVELFGIDPSEAAVELNATVKRLQDECHEYCEPHHAAQQQTEPAPSSGVPVMDDPDPGVLPDLVALPAWGIRVENRRTRSFLSFGATVWNGGSAPLVVEGFRRSGEALMDAYQYFYDGADLVGKSVAGELKFDGRRSHEHWHFKQFAAYSLLDATATQVTRSRKEAFCLAPTDAIDLTIPEAEWNPGSIGLGTACGSPSSIWIREMLPLGWGDTYFQGLPGQSFNITSLPNGAYYIRVEANPGQLLREQRSDNNVELRRIVLKGRPGARRAVVGLWNGIDTEERMREDVPH